MYRLLPAGTWLHGSSVKRAIRPFVMLAASTLSSVALTPTAFAQSGTTTGSAAASRIPVGDTARYRVHKPEKEAETEGATLRYRGELPMSLDDYSESGRDFWKLVHGKGWNGWRSSRKCKGDAACSGGADAGEMVAQGILDSHLVPVDLPKDVKGVVVGRVVNTGDYDDYATGIPGNQGAYPDEYYFVIEPGTKDKARLRVAIVRFGAKKKPFNHLTIIEAPNGYVRCDPHLDPKPTIGEGDFKSCPRSLPSSDTKGRRKAASSMTSRPSVSSTEALAWLSCTDGCCSASWPPSSMFRRHRRRGDDR